MNAMTAAQARIYHDYAKSHNYKPMMSVGFEFCFMDAEGKEHRVSMTTMKAEVLADRAALKAAREREAKYGTKKTKI